MASCRITAAIIVRDSAATLEMCLESIKPFVDDIVVLDTGSEDDTVVIARRFTNNIYVSENVVPKDQFHFSNARNEVLARCRLGDWIISIDSDERAVGDHAGLRRLLEQNNEAAHNVMVDVPTLARCEFASRRKFQGSRLFRNDGETRWIFRVHEMLVPCTPMHVIPETLLCLHHLRQDIDSSLDRNLKLLQMQYAEEMASGNGGGIIKTLLDLGQCYNDIARYPEAVGALEVCVSILGPALGGRFRSLIHHNLATAYWGAGVKNRAFDHATHAVELTPRRISAVILAASCCLELNEWERGIEWLARVTAVTDPIREFNWEGQADYERDWIADRTQFCQEQIKNESSEKLPVAV